MGDEPTKKADRVRVLIAVHDDKIVGAWRVVGATHDAARPHQRNPQATIELRDFPGADVLLDRGAAVNNGHDLDMDDRSRLPRGLQPPAYGDTVTVGWRADLGREARVGDVGNHLHDLQVAIDLGERWGTLLATAAAVLLFEEQVRGAGPGFLSRELDQWNIDPRVAMHIEEWVLTGEWPRRRDLGRFAVEGPLNVVRLISNRRVPELLGEPATAQHVEYRNPVEVVLIGSGLLLLGTVKVLRLIRDWSTDRRTSAARADVADAVARTYKSRARLADYLVREAIQGREHVPVGDLLGVTTAVDLDAVERLTSTDVRLELPPGLASGD